MTWQTIKILSISALLLVPAMQGMQELTLNEKSLPVELRHRGYTPLHVAIFLGNRDQITRLIADGVVDARNISGSTPLHIAAEKGDLETVEALIAELQKINSFACPLNKQTLDTTSIVDTEDNSGITPLACAAANGHIDVLGCLIAHGASICHADKRGLFPFHRATQNGHLEAMRMLLPDLQFDRAHRAGRLEPILSAAGSNDDLDFRSFCWDALECAVASGKAEVLAFVMKLIEGRCNPETGHPLEQCGSGITPFLLAAEYGHVHLLQLLSDADKNRIHALDKEGATALQHAARYGQIDAAQFILERDPEKINRHKNDVRTTQLAGSTPLHEAAYYGHTKVLELLLASGVEIESTDAKGRTALHLAAMKGHQQVLELLLSSGASVAATDAGLGRTPLHLAAEKGHTDCVETLLAHKADIEAEDIGNRTALHEAAEEGQLEVAKCLLKNGADISKKSALGTALMHAIMNEHVDVIKYFILNTSAELTAHKTHFGGTVPLIFIAVVRETGSESVRCLLANGVSVATPLRSGRTILHHYSRWYSPTDLPSLMSRDLVIHDLLMRAGADMLCPDNEGVTPLDRLNLPADQLTVAKQYYQNRPLYLKGQLGEDETLDAVFSQAAEVRIDIPVLVGLKDQLNDRLVQHRWKGGKNLLMVALAIKDLDGIIQILDQKICSITDVDDENHDALWFAINASKPSLINKALEAGATVTEDHLLQAASFESEKDFSEILLRLLTTYRYSQRPVHERVSLFK